MQTSPGVGSNTPQKPSYLLQKLHVIPSPAKHTHMQEAFLIWMNHRKAPTALAGCVRPTPGTQGIPKASREDLLLPSASDQSTLLY